MPSEVYFVRGKPEKNKTEELFERAGFDKLIKEGDLVAVKVHFGDRGNTRFVSPEYIRPLVDKVKEKKGKPFITDTNTLYRGYRENAVDHLGVALDHDFTRETVGAPLVIADGLRGENYVEVDIGKKHFQKVKIARGIYSADALIGIAHLTAHMEAGLAGILKTLGMGGASRAGKQMQHIGTVPQIAKDICIGCALCKENCPAEAIEISKKKADINKKLCIGCGECVVVCRQEAVSIRWDESGENLQEKIAEYALGVLKNKKGKSGFISFMVNITRDCDCVGHDTEKIAPDIGVLFSLDPVAIDQAAGDLVKEKAGKDKFKERIAGKDWQVQLRHAQELGLGTREYKLIEIDPHLSSPTKRKD